MLPSRLGEASSIYIPIYTSVFLVLVVVVAQRSFCTEVKKITGLIGAEGENHASI